MFSKLHSLGPESLVFRDQAKDWVFVLYSTQLLQKHLTKTTAVSFNSLTLSSHFYEHVHVVLEEPWFLVQSSDLESNAFNWIEHIQRCFLTLLLESLFFSHPCLAVTANTIRDLGVPSQQHLCAVSFVHHDQLPAAFCTAVLISTVARNDFADSTRESLSSFLITWNVPPIETEV